MRVIFTGSDHRKNRFTIVINADDGDDADRITDAAFKFAREATLLVNVEQLNDEGRSIYSSASFTPKSLRDA